jgi:phenylpropionate dioxygenase-like ring-hydroxylating dioxygenase large terminal subunit
MQQPTNNLLQQLAQNANASFDEALSLPPAIYHSPEILELERNNLFRKEWICVGRTAEFPGQGDFLCRDIFDAPVFVMRQRDGSLKAFANVCAHRASRLLDGAGHVSRISCPYHSWTYELDGQLIGAPFMDKTPDFNVANHKLTELACETWEGFIYVSLQARPTPIDERLGGLTKLVSGFRMADYVPVFAEEETWNTNWKCLVENFMDAYHVHRVHRDSFGKHGSSEGQTSLFPGDDAFTYHYVRDEEGPHSVQAHPDNTWLQGPDRLRTWLINVFPSHTIQLQPDMLWYLSILPDGIDKVNIRWAVSIPAEILDAAKVRQAVVDEVMTLIHQVNGEDRPIVENVFQSTAVALAHPCAPRHKCVPAHKAAPTFQLATVGAALAAIPFYYSRIVLALCGCTGRLVSEPIVL